RLSQSANLLAELRGAQTTEGFLTALNRAVTLAEGAGIDPAELSGLMAEAAAVFDAAAAGAPRPFDWSRALSAEAPAGALTRVITVQPALDYERLNPAKPALAAVAEEIAGLDPALAGLVEIGVTGDPALRAEELSSVTARLAQSLGLSLILVAAVLFMALGGPGRVGLALATVLVTLVLTTGFAALAVGALNLISIAFVVLMVGLGIDFAIHLLAHLDEDRARGLTAAEALAATGSSIGGALTLSAATTALAFLAFTTTDFIGMAQLGLIGGVGVLLALLVALTLIPAAVALRPGLARGRGPMALPRLGRGTALPLAVAALATGAVAAIFAPSARFDADPMALRAAAAPSVAAFGWLTEDPALAPLRLSVMVDAEAEAEALAETARAAASVRSAVWLGDLVPKDQDAKLDEIDLAYPSLDFAVSGEAVDLGAPDPSPLPPRLRALDTPEATALAAALERWQAAGTGEGTGEGAGRGTGQGTGEGQGAGPLSAALFRFFPAVIERIGLILEAGPVTRADLPEAMTARYLAEDGRLRVEIAAAEDITDPAARGRFVEAVLAALPEAGGPPAQIEGAAGTVAAAMLSAAGLALLGTAVLAALTLRSGLQVAAILLPLALAGLVTMAASALLDIPFNYANVIVLPLMIGIGVDAGVHLAVRTARLDTEERRGGVFDSSTPRAVLASALTTIAAFGTLALSEHRGTASMGIMLAIALTASVLMIFALTPPLVALSNRVSRRAPGGTGP
ncbi:MAG: MMPL family transporter, partial [Pseudomonadota bacterium]